MKITDQIFFITGASSGLGLATAQKLYSLGARLALLDRSEDDSSAGHFDPGRVVFCRADVCSEADIQDAIRKVDDKWPGGVVGGVVNAAGVGMAEKVSQG